MLSCWAIFTSRARETVVKPFRVSKRRVPCEQKDTSSGGREPLPTIGLVSLTFPGGSCKTRSPCTETNRNQLYGVAENGSERRRGREERNRGIDPFPMHEIKTFPSRYQRAEFIAVGQHCSPMSGKICIADPPGFRFQRVDHVRDASVIW